MTTDLLEEEEIPDEVGGATPVGAVVPSIPNSAQTDVPPPGDSSSFLVDTPPDPHGDHNRWVDKFKLTFAVWVVLASFIVVVGLSLTQFILQKQLESAALDSAIDWAKSVATIALGFALGRSFEEGRNNQK